MPTWSNQLPTVQKHMGFDLRRTPQSGSLRAVVTSDDLLVVDTHFFHGRTLPCERNEQGLDGQLCAGNCPACRESIPYRTHVYISAYQAKNREHFLFECTAHAGKPFAEYRDAAGTLRGCLFDASRPKGAKNSRVAIATATANLASISIPEPPDLIKALSVIWRLPMPAFSASPRDSKPPKVSTRSAPLDRMREQPDNMPDPPSVADIISGNGKKKVLI